MGRCRGGSGQGLSLYDVDLDRLRTLRPDVVLTQAQCEACAVSLQGLEAALGSGHGWADVRRWSPSSR